MENFPGFPSGINGPELCEKFREQSSKVGTRIFTETVNKVDLSKRPFRLTTDLQNVECETLIIATGAVARRMDFKGSGEDGFWNRGISACAVCDGAAPIFRNKPLAVIGGGDSAMEEATFLTKFASKVYVVHRRNELRASKIMQNRAKANPKIEFLLSHVPIEAYGTKLLQGLRLESTETKQILDLPVSGLFFAIGHQPATAFLEGQLALDKSGYIITKPGHTTTSVPGVFACGDVQDSKWRQAITAAGSGCISALEAEHFLAAL